MSIALLYCEGGAKSPDLVAIEAKKPGLWTLGFGTWVWEHTIFVEVQFFGRI